MASKLAYSTYGTVFQQNKWVIGIILGPIRLNRAILVHINWEDYKLQIYDDVIIQNGRHKSHFDTFPPQIRVFGV